MAVFLCAIALGSCYFLPGIVILWFVRWKEFLVCGKIVESMENAYFLMDF